jgi:hypothetical protein
VKKIRKCVGFGEFLNRKKKNKWHGDNIENICDQVGNFVPDEQESGKKQKFDYPFREIREDEMKIMVKSTTFQEFYQWSTQMQDPPLHWKLHMNNFIMYVTDSADYPIARIFKIDKDSSQLKLIKTVKLAQECK